MGLASRQSFFGLYAHVTSCQPRAPWTWSVHGQAFCRSNVHMSFAFSHPRGSIAPMVGMNGCLLCMFMLELLAQMPQFEARGVEIRLLRQGVCVLEAPEVWLCRLGSEPMDNNLSFGI